VRSASEVAGALDHAHRLGIVHRDIKPENIMLQDGHVLVADFGIGKAISDTTADTLTQVGMSVGTPAYMSPEQAVGEDVDGRSDLYSLACVLYEMLVGEPPFTGPTAQAVIAKRFVQTPADVTALREGVSREIARALQRALSRIAIDRFDTAREFAAALLETATEPAPRSAKLEVPERSVAVLAFESAGGDTDDEFFADGVTEEILTALAQHPELKVAGRASSFSFKGKTIDPRQIAEQLGVRTLLEGSVRRSRDRVRITARLVDATDGYQLWAERYDRRLEDVFAVQDEIAAAITEKLRATLAVDSAARRQRTTASVEAYEAYLKGRALLYRRGRYIKAALAQFERALEYDPTYALAWAGIADTCSLQAYFGQVRTVDARDRAREASEQALRHGPDLAEAHAARGFYEMVFEWNWKGAEAHFSRGDALDPSYMQGAAWYAMFFRGCLCGEWPASIAIMESLVARDPLSAYVQGMYSAVLGFGTGTPAGLAASHRAGELDPDAFMTWFSGQCAWCGTDDAVGMRRTSEMAWSVSGRLMFSLVIYGLWCAQQGERETARLVLDELDARAPREPALHFSRGVIALMVGDRARGEPMLQQAIAERDPQVWMWGPVWPAFPMLRELADDPAYRAVREASGIAGFLRERSARASGANAE
jgi:eukaryotic-like serine/threonine-protein kinase